MNILMLEDDPAIAQGLRYSLESEGYTVTHCATVTRRWRRWAPGDSTCACWI